MFSDTFKVKESESGIFYEVEGKVINSTVLILRLISLIDVKLNNELSVMYQHS